MQARDCSHTIFYGGHDGEDEVQQGGRDGDFGRKVFVVISLTWQAILAWPMAGRNPLLSRCVFYTSPRLHVLFTEDISRLISCRDTENMSSTTTPSKRIIA